MLAELVAANVTARPLPDDRLTVGKWINRWLARQKTEDRLRPNTIAAYDRSVRILLPVLGSIPIRRLRSSQVSDALASLRGRYSPHSIAGARTVLSTAIKDAMREGHILTNEASLARAPRVPRTTRTAPDSMTVRAILAAMEGHRLRPLYVLLAGTGLRIGEATGLRWEEDIQPDTITVHVQLQRMGAEHVLTDPKSDSSGRIVFQPPAVKDALRAHKARQAEERIAAGRKWRKSGLVFTTTTGEAIAESTAQWVLSEACKRAGVRHVAPHDLRRFYLTTVADVAGRDVAQRLGGHTAPTMTDRYLAITDIVRQAASDALQEALG